MSVAVDRISKNNEPIKYEKGLNNFLEAKATSLVDARESLENCKKVFEIIDIDKNGYLSQEELKKAVKSDILNGQFSRIVKHFIVYQDYFQNLSDDEFLRDNDGITIKDLIVLRKKVVESLEEREKKGVTQVVDIPDSLLNPYSRNLVQTFRYFDADRDNRLTKEELSIACEYRDLSEKHKTEIKYLHDNYEYFQKKYRDNLILENDGISLNDLIKFQNDFAPEISKDLKKANSIFDETIDKDRDGSLTKKEISKALSSSHVEGEVASELSAIFKKYDQIKLLSKDSLFLEDCGVSLNDLNALNKLENKHILSELHDIINKTKSILNNKPVDLFGGIRLPSIQAFKQNNLGDCYLLSVVGCLAVARPETLMNLFSRYDDKGFIVDLPGSAYGQFMIEAPHDGELMTYARVDPKHGYWPLLIEKAVGRFRSAFSEGSSMHSSVDHGGDPAGVIELLTGNVAYTRYFYDNDPRQVEKELISALSNKKAVVLTTSEINKEALRNSTLSSNHATSLIGYNSETKLFTIVDPNKVMEIDSRYGDGIMHLNVNQVMHYFSWIHCETDEPLKHKRTQI